MQHDNPDATPVTGQGDELDRGTGGATSGGGLGKSTGFWSEHGARENMKANDIDDSVDGEVVREKRAGGGKEIVVDDELARPKEDRSPLT